MRSGRWQPDIARDGFSGQVACRLRARDEKSWYRAGAIGFRLGHRADIIRAFYRIDGQQVRAQRDDLPRLLAIGVPMDQGGMEDPYQGIVWVPLDSLRNARTIAIVAQPGHREQRFALDGAAQLHDRATAIGCSPDSRLVEQ